MSGGGVSGDPPPLVSLGSGLHYRRQPYAAEVGL